MYGTGKYGSTACSTVVQVCTVSRQATGRYVTSKLVAAVAVAAWEVQHVFSRFKHLHDELAATGRLPERHLGCF